MNKKIAKKVDGIPNYFIQFRDPQGNLNQEILNLPSSTTISQMQAILS